MRHKVLLMCSACALCFSVNAMTIDLPASGNVAGDAIWIFAEPGESLRSIGNRHGMGYEEMVRANQHVLPYRVKPWSKIVIPKSFILPDAPRTGIVINLPEMRLYFYPKGQNKVMTFPIGIGREGWLTPIMRTSIVEKTENPFWYPPDSIIEYMAEKGVVLPEVMPPGPDNPLGDYAMRLGNREYLIHGTNRPESVGIRSSSGCIRMIPEHVEELFPHVEVGTQVSIVNQPYKAGWKNDEFVMEVHKPFDDNPPPIRPGEVGDLQWVIDKNAGVEAKYIDWDDVSRVVRQANGFPNAVDFKFWKIDFYENIREISQ